MHINDWLHAVRQSVTPPSDPTPPSGRSGEPPLWKVPTGLASDGLPSGWGPGYKFSSALPRVLGHAAGGAVLGGGVGAVAGDDVDATRVGVGALLGGLGGGAVGALRGVPKGPAISNVASEAASEAAARTAQRSAHFERARTQADHGMLTLPHMLDWMENRAAFAMPSSMHDRGLTHVDRIVAGAHTYGDYDATHLKKLLDNMYGTSSYADDANSLPYSMLLHLDNHRPGWRDNLHHPLSKTSAFGAPVVKTLQSAASALKPLATSVSNKIKPALGSVTQSAMGASSGAKPISPWTVGSLGTTGALTALHPFSPTKRAALDPGEADDIAAAFGGRIPAGMEHLYGAQDAAQIQHAAPAHAPTALEYHSPLHPEPVHTPALPGAPASYVHADWDQIPQPVRDQALLKGLAPEPGSMRAPGFWRRAALPLAGASLLGGAAGYGVQHGLGVGGGMPDWALPAAGAVAAPALGAGGWALLHHLKR